MTTSTAQADPLVCGSTENGGLTHSECIAFRTELARLRNLFKMCRKPLWEKAPNGAATLYVPWRHYCAATVSFTSFNGCSSTVMQNFASLLLALDTINYDNPYDICGLERPKLDIEKFKEFALYELFNVFIVGGPLFLNLPPAESLYGAARRFLAKHKAEVACEFVNPNYPDRAARKEYTTLFVFDHRKWMNPGKTPLYKGLVK